MTQHVLIIGATGMLGRPVARRLVLDGFKVRAFVRSPDRANTLLPPSCELLPGDLRDASALASAMRGIDAVYINLAAPMVAKVPKYEPELHGTRAVIDAVKRAGVQRIVRISALGVDDAADVWWAAKQKSLADRAVIESGIPYTIFRPTWFMESLATLMMGRLIMSFHIPGPLRWIAGNDYAAQVVAALRSEQSMNRIYLPQGPELLTVGEAVRRFARAWPKRLLVMPVPWFALKSTKVFGGQAAYLVSLLQMTIDHFSRLDRTEFDTDLPRAEMRIEGYVNYALQTGDVPRKN